jgi:hypothetical protein
VRKPPRDEIQSIIGQMCHPTITRISLEAKALLLGQFPAHSDGYSLPDEFSSLYQLPCFFGTTVFSDLSVHASDLPSSSDNEYFMLFSCIPMTIHEI